MTKKKMNGMKKMVLTGAAVMVMMSFAAPAMAAGVGSDHEDSSINTGKTTSIN